MAKVLGKAITLLSALAFAGCSAGMSVDEGTPVNTAGGTGSVDFNLDIPNGESIDEILLHLVCADGIDQTHTLDVVDGEVLAGFGGLTPGQCTATMTSQTPDGTDCIGETTFTVVEATTTPVTVTLMCQDVNQADGGSARIHTEFEMKECSVDRIRKIWAIPANLLEGESTTVEVEAWPGTLVTLANPATWSFEVVSGGSVSSALGCSGDACSDFVCGAVPPGSPVNPDTSLPTNTVAVQVTVEDDDCYDTETVYVECGQASVCSNGVQEGLEECDGTAGVGAGEACDASCHLLYCGDGAVNVAGEVCDGTAGVGAHQHCDSSCHLVNDPYCGDNITNDGTDLPGAEQCDGTVPGYPLATCSGTCTINVACGNGIIEGSEACDNGSGNGLFPAPCSTSCTVNTAPNLCKNCVQADSTASAYVTPCLGSPTCLAVLDCITADTTNCWLDPLIGGASCYCGVGTDSSDCEAPGFTPGTTGVGHTSLGVCWSQMKAAANTYYTLPATATNSDVLNWVYDFGAHPNLGNAGQALDKAYYGSCAATCAAH